MKNSSGNRWVVEMLSADQKPFVAVEASPPWATAMLPSQRESPSTFVRYRSAWAQPAAGVY